MRNALQPLTDMRARALETATARYEADALLSEPFAAWLTRRGLSEATANTFRLGVVGENPLPGHDGYRGRIAIPYITANNRVVQLRFRCIEPHSCDGHPKYLGEPGDDVRLFNVRSLVEPGLDIHVTEGEIDCMVLSQMGLSAVAVPGVGAWSPRHVLLLQGYRRVFVWGDGDQAGRDFVRTVQDGVKQAVSVPVPNGQDVNSLLLNGGEDAVLAPLHRAKEAYS